MNMALPFYNMAYKTYKLCVFLCQTHYTICIIVLWSQQSAVFSSSWSATPPVCLTSHLALIYNHAHLVLIPYQPHS